MLSHTRSRSDSRPRPIHVPGRNTKVRSLIDFYNQKALQKSVVVTSKPIHDRHRIPSDKVRSLVQNFSRAASAASGSGVSSRSGGRMLKDGAASPVAFRNGGKVIRDGTGSPVASRNVVISPVALKGQVELSVIKIEIDQVPQKTRYHPRRTSGGLRTAKNWKPARPQGLEKPIMTSEADDPVARKSTRRKKTSRRASVKNIVDFSEESMSPKLIQPLTAPILKALESEITRSSSLEMEISTTPGDIISDSESASPQTSESSSKKFREQNKTRIEIKATEIEDKIIDTQPETSDTLGKPTNPEQETMVPQASLTISKRSGSWKGALKTVRDSFRKKSTTTESSLSAKLSDESILPSKPQVINSLVNNLTPDSPVTSYLTAPDSFKASTQNPISHVQAQVQKLQMLETVDSEPENENTLPSDTDARKSLSKLDADKVLQEVSGPSLSQFVEDPNTISGMGEMASWDSTVSRQKKRTRTYKTAPIQRKGERRPVAGVFRSPVRRRESPLKPVSPLRVVKEKTPTIQETSEPATAIGPAKSEPGVLLNRPSMDTLTSFEELSLPNSLGSPDKAQKEKAQTSKRLAAVVSTFESLSDLTTPPPARPLQEVRSPTLMREMAFPSLRLRAYSGDASMEKKYSSEDTLEVVKPVSKHQEGIERNPIPKKRIFGDADWRTDRNVSGNKNTNEANQKLQELDEGSLSSYDSQRSSSISGEPEPDFTALPWQNYIPIQGTSDSGDEYGGMIEAEVPFLKYIINPPPPAGTPPPIYPTYQKNREPVSRPFNGGTSVIEVGADGQDEMVTRGRRRTRIGS